MLEHGEDFIVQRTFILFLSLATISNHPDKYILQLMIIFYHFITILLIIVS